MVAAGEEYSDFAIVDLSDKTFDKNYMPAAHPFEIHVDSGCTPYHITNTTKDLTLSHNKPIVELKSVDGSQLLSLDMTGTINGTTALIKTFKLRT